MLPNTFFEARQGGTMMPTVPVAQYQYPPNWMLRRTGHFQTHQNQILGEATKSNPLSTNNTAIRFTVQPTQQCAPGETAGPPNRLVLCDCQGVPIPQGLAPFPVPAPCPPPPPKKKKKKNLCPLASNRYCSKPGCPLGFPELPQPVHPDCVKTGTGQREHFIVTLLPEDKGRFDMPSPDWLKTLPYPNFPCVTDRMVQWEDVQDGKGKKEKKGAGNEKGKGKGGKK